MSGDHKDNQLEKFLEIIARLRGEGGCPWDREQTHESLRPCMMEEAAELVAAIRIYRETGSYENMREELGDVLLQVVMHAQIASEEGLFTMDDVIAEVSEKMVRRHPHVFGAASADDSEQVLRTWEEIKKAEKAGKDWIASPLREIPRELPALTRAVKVGKKIDKLYEKQPDAKEAARRLGAAAGWLRELADSSGSTAEMEEAIGDILVQICTVAGQFRLSPEQILTDRTEGLIDRYEKREER